MTTEPVNRIVGYDEDGHLIDRLGRRQPTRFNLVWAFRAYPALAAQFKREVPGDFIAEDVEDDETPVMVVACPCGKEPRVPRGGMTECECERFYLNLGNSVRVACSPTDQTKSEADE